MYFPKLFDLFKSSNGRRYSSDIVAKTDDYLGTLKFGTVFNESDFNFHINNILLTEAILSDLVNLEIVEEVEEDLQDSNESEPVDKKFMLLVQPNKAEDRDYQQYIREKRKIDSFSIIFEKTKSKKSGALTLIDIKGYSKNVNSSENNVPILLLIENLQRIIDECIKEYFLNSYSGIEIKHNGDGWFFYFLYESESYDFLNKVLTKCGTDVVLKRSFKDLQTTLKCYIHHTNDIERIYKVDTLHFDMEGKDVILIHMLEKPIEKALYSGIISNDSNFIAVTESVLSNLIEKDRKNFNRLVDLKLDIVDSEGNSKFYDPNIKVFYQEFPGSNTKQ